MTVQLTKNIWRHELVCSCGCGSDSMDFETINIVQEACDYFAKKQGTEKVKLDISSAHRCYEYNRSEAVGSNDRSQHPRARGMDIAIDGVPAAQVYAYFTEKYPGKYGFGSYKTFTHVDTRTNGPARW